MSDDLSAPLGRKSKRGSAKYPLAIPAAMAGTLGLGLVVFVLWAAFVRDPLGGEPAAVIAIDVQAGGAGKTAARVATGQPDNAETESKVAVRTDPAAKPPTQTVTIIDGSSGSRQVVEIPDQRAAAKPVQDESKLLDSSRHGAIPRIGPDGVRPSVAYAQPVAPTSPGKANLPRVALVVGGLGISGNTTAEALGKLPGPVSFAFSPYGSDIERLASRARGEGHELLLQIPMEPLDFPENDPGPQTLLTSLAPEQNIDRLHWLMSRFQGYVGISNFMGARFTATESAFTPILREAGKRGLLYLDDASSPRSLAGQIAGANNIAFAKAAIVLDSVATPGEIDRALGRLEALARDNGIAVGYVSAKPVSIDRLSHWAKGAEARGILLVPISAATGKPKSS